MGEISDLRMQILDNIHALEPHLIEPKWVLYCETKSTDVFASKNGGSGDMINPDDQAYTKHCANGWKDYYTVVVFFSERFGINGIRIFKESGDTPKLAHEALLRQLAKQATDNCYVPS